MLGLGYQEIDLGSLANEFEVFDDWGLKGLVRVSGTNASVGKRAKKGDHPQFQPSTLPPLFSLFLYLFVYTTGSRSVLYVFLNPQKRN
jgi:hypothetical protein